MMPLIFSADDFAQNAAIDAGILDLIRMGRLTATSCLTLSPRWQEAASTLTASIRQQADIGLHLDFTQFSHPVRYPHPQLIVRSLLHSLSKQQIHTTIAYQLDAFENALNSAPDYVDGHQHVHQLPQIRDILLRELQSRYAAKLPWIRVSHAVHDGMKGRVISALGSRAMQQQARQHGFATTDILLGVYAFNSDVLTYQTQLQRWLMTLPQVLSKGQMCALMCHPALASRDETDAIRHARVVEYQVLSSPEFGDLLQNVGVQPAKGSLLLAAR